MRSRGPTKRCITLPGVNKPRGRGLARGSPLRLRLLLRLCISSAVPPPRSLSSTSVDHNILSLPPISRALAPSRSSPRLRTKTANNALSLLFLLPLPLSPLPPPSLSLSLSLSVFLLLSPPGWSPANYFLPGELIWKIHHRRRYLF